MPAALVAANLSNRPALDFLNPVAGSSNGRTLGSGPSSLGSNPSPAASVQNPAKGGVFSFAEDAVEPLDRI